MPRSLVTLFAPLAMAASLGCSSSPSLGDMEGQSGDMVGQSGDLAGGGADDLSNLGGYPAGPYGNKLGDTFPPLMWEGYAATTGAVLVNTLPYGNYAMDDARRSGKKYAMVHESAFY